MKFKIQISKKHTFFLLSTLILIVLSPYATTILFKSSMYDIIPPTILQFVLMTITGKFSLVILPAAYLLMSLICQKKHFPVVLFTVVTIFLVMNTYYFFTAWPYGIKYQGAVYTVLMTLINSLSFFLTYLFIWLYKKEKKVIFIYLANFLFMLTLTFLAFPWFGESI